jgi:hypothetical protein
MLIICVPRITTTSPLTSCHVGIIFMLPETPSFGSFLLEIYDALVIISILSLAISE